MTILRPSTIGRTIPGISESLRMNQINLGRRELAAEEDWHYVGDPGEPGFQNNFQNYGGAQERLAYRRDTEGKIHFKGVIKAGAGVAPTGVNIFQLPSSHYPLYLSDNQQPVVGRQSGAVITPFWWYQNVEITSGGVVRMAMTWEIHLLVMDNIVVWGS